MASEETWHFAAGIAGNLFALVLFLSPIPTFVKVRRNKSIEQFSSLPYLFALLNCLICSWYGLPFVSKDNVLLTTVNGTGAVFQLFYICIYIAYSRKEARVKTVALLLLVLSIFIVIATVSYGVMKQPMRMMFIGCLSVVSLVCMFASPLSIIVRTSGWKKHTTLGKRLVVQTNSVEYMPFYLSLSTFLMSTSFFAYGIFGHDPFVSIPNGIGSFLGIIQLVLYFHYSRVSRRSCDTQPLLSSRV